MANGDLAPAQGGQARQGGESGFPRCMKCGDATLVPLSDFGGQGAAVHYKAWVCTDPKCLFNLKIRNGDIILNEPVYDGAEDRR